MPVGSKASRVKAHKFPNSARMVARRPAAAGHGKTKRVQRVVKSTQSDAIFVCAAGSGGGRSRQALLHRFGPVITTARPHGISSWRRLRPKILLWGVGISHLEGAWEVRVLNSTQLLLRDQSFPAAESSHGFCRLMRPGCMIWASVLGVPVLLASLLHLLLLSFSTSFNAQLVLAAPAVVLALSSYWHQVMQTKNPLHQKIHWYRERMKNKHVASEFGALGAVHLRHLSEFYSTFETFILQRDMFYIQSNIIVPLTRPLNLSFADMIGPYSAPYFYVSYLWAWKLSTMLTCLRAHAEVTDAKYWMDVFSSNQIEKEGGHCLFESSVYKSVSGPLCQGVVIPFPHPPGLDDWLHRSWCIWELYTFVQSNDDNNLDVDRVSFCAPSGVLNRGQCSPEFCMECLERLINLDLGNLGNISKSLEQHIRVFGAYIEQGAWRDFDKILRSSFRKIVESVQHLATLHGERVKSHLLLQSFSQLLQRRGSDTQDTCPPGPERSITAGQLAELQTFFASVLDCRNMYWVCDEIVKPLTRKKEVSYAELVGCGMVRWFISHWWGMQFNLTVKSILNHAREFSGEDMRYWLCTFSNNQWKMHEEIPPQAPPSESSFYKALRSPSCLGTCMILDARVVPLSRAWCLFELLQTFLIQDEVPTRESLNILTSSGVMNSGRCSIDMAMAIGKQLTSLKLEDAGATKETDIRLIFTAVERAGGFQAINAKLKHRIRKVISVVASQFDQDLQQLHVELGKQKAAFC
eukprot:s4614_g2.t1